MGKITLKRCPKHSPLPMKRLYTRERYIKHHQWKTRYTPVGWICPLCHQISIDQDTNIDDLFRQTP